jgi:hypothetical protein
MRISPSSVSCSSKVVVLLFSTDLMAIPVGRGLDGVSFRDLGFSFSRREPMDPCFWAIFLSFLVLLTTADLKWFILPHPMNNLFVACGLTSHWLRRNEWGSRGLADSLVGFTVFGACFSCRGPVLARKDGGGDIKMMSGIGAC